LLIKSDREKKMTEETTSNAEAQTPEENTTAEAQPAAAAKPKKEKAPALEDKPFNEFIEQHFNPALKKALTGVGVNDVDLTFAKQPLGVAGASADEQYWQIHGNWKNGQRQFNLYFLDEKIDGKKAFSCGTNATKPSTIESFMIDERKVTLDLMVLYTLQRLNGQKWLTRN
jgi:Protein of unknown function (DUF2996)